MGKPAVKIDELISLSHAAEILGVAVSTINRAENSGALEIIRIDGKPFVTREAVDRYDQDHRRKEPLRALEVRDGLSDADRASLEAAAAGDGVLARHAAVVLAMAEPGAVAKDVADRHGISRPMVYQILTKFRVGQGAESLRRKPPWFHKKQNSQKPE